MLITHSDFEFCNAFLNQQSFYNPGNKFPMLPILRVVMCLDSRNFIRSPQTGSLMNNN